MNKTIAEIRALAAAALLRSEIQPASIGDISVACAWLEACGYPGLRMLEEALVETPPENQRPVLEHDALGVDLRNVSCVFSVPRLAALAVERQRVFLRNVRHGLYLLPFAVKTNIGIGCPVDPAFALGGERTKNPYGEKLALAEQNGVNVDDGVWERLTAHANDLSLS